MGLQGALWMDGGETASDGEVENVGDEIVKVSKLAAASVSFHFSSSRPH